MINFDVLMLPVLSFSFPKSERRHAIEYNTDFNEPQTCWYRITLLRYRELKQETYMQAGLIISSYLFLPEQTDGQIYSYKHTALFQIYLTFNTHTSQRHPPTPYPLRPPPLTYSHTQAKPTPRSPDSSVDLETKR